MNRSSVIHLMPSVQAATADAISKVIVPVKDRRMHSPAVPPALTSAVAFSRCLLPMTQAVFLTSTRRAVKAQGVLFCCYTECNRPRGLALMSDSGLDRGIISFSTVLVLFLDSEERNGDSLSGLKKTHCLVLLSDISPEHGLES